MLERGEILDLLFSENECLVLAQDRCLRLSAVPTEVLAYLTLPRTLTDVNRHLEETFGPAPEGAFETLLEELTRNRLVNRTDVLPTGHKP